jgi:integrase
MIAAYLAAHASSCSVATLGRRLAALSKAHRSRGYESPASAELIKSTLQGIKRVKGTAQRQATPLIKEDLFLVLEGTGSRLRDTRDRALLLIGFAGGFRRSELIGLDCSDVLPVRQGLEISIRRSKTDQDSRGRKIGIPFARGHWCHDVIGIKRLSGEAVSLVVRERVSAAGIDSRPYSGHSLRSGLATSAAAAGVPSWKIRQQTGHSSDAMLARYIRDGERFSDNAAGIL